MREWWQVLLERVREKWAPLQHVAPFLASGLILAAGFCSSRPLRFLCLLTALALLLSVAADFARSLLDHESATSGYQGPPKQIPVTRLQVLFTVIVAATYFCMIFAGMHLLLFSSLPLLLVMTPAILVFSSLAAWRNVRLWYREGTDYEQVLQEEERESHKLEIPPVS